MGFATSIEMASFLGTDESTDNNGGAMSADGLRTPGGIVVETLLNIRTVAALTLEQQRFSDYKNALDKAEPNRFREALVKGSLSGSSAFIQQWVFALQFWFGAWLLYNFPEDYDFSDFLIANFAMLFALFGLGAAFQDISDRKEVEKSAGRIFYLLDRKSSIDPLGEGGKLLE
jgi:ATP-binding cassette, subfamily B (MDR/TAP), member 1